MTRQNSGGDDFRIEAWNKSRQTARDNDLDFANLKKQYRNTSHLITRKMRGPTDKIKIANIPDDIFYDDAAMMKMPLPSYDNKPIDLGYFKNKVAGFDKTRPKLAEALFDDHPSMHESQYTHSQTRS